MEAVRAGVVRLTICEATHIVDALLNAQVSKSLSGDQRHHIGEAMEGLTEAIESAGQDSVEISTDTALAVLRCFAFTQARLC